MIQNIKDVKDLFKQVQIERMNVEVRVIVKDSNITNMDFDDLEDNDECLGINFLAGDDFNKELLNIHCAVDFTIGADESKAVFAVYITEETAVNALARKEEGVITYVVSWQGESRQHELHCSEGSGRFVYEKEFATFADAKDFYKEEIAQVDMKRFTDLEFSPTDDECRTNGQVLGIDMVITDEDGYRDIRMLKVSEDYWIDD